MQREALQQLYGQRGSFPPPPTATQSRGFSSQVPVEAFVRDSPPSASISFPNSVFFSGKLSQNSPMSPEFPRAALFCVSTKPCMDLLVESYLVGPALCISISRMPLGHQ